MRKLSIQVTDMPGTRDAERLIEAITLAYQQLSQISDDLHLARGITTGMRSVLLMLDQGGDQTVPALANQRCVSRQFLHRLTCTLQEGGWVAFRDNPRHRRSPLVTLTEQGHQEIADIRRLEAPLLESFVQSQDDDAIALAAKVVVDLCRQGAASRT